MKRVLVADDDEAMRDLVATALRADGHDVSVVADGGRLLVAIARCCRAETPMPDLIVSDVRMPVMTGLAMLKGLRDAHRETPVILMTAFPDPETRWHARLLDATILAKPFPIGALTAAVDAALHDSPTRQHEDGATWPRSCVDEAPKGRPMNPNRGNEGSTRPTSDAPAPSHEDRSR